MTSPVLRWLDDPPADRGIRFATDADRWVWHPYRELAARTRRMAASLRAVGLPTGARVAVVTRTGPSFVSAFFGALSAGCVPAPVATPAAFQFAAGYAAHLTGALRSVRPSVVLSDADLLAQLRPLVAGVGAAPVLDAAVLDDAPEGAGEGPAGPAPDADDPAMLQLTSGTSGTVRAVRVSHGALAANVRAIRSWLRMTPDDPTASWLPVHHDMGLVGCLVAPVVNGSDLWLMRPEQFVRDPLRYLRCLGGHGVRLTAMPGFGLGYLVRRVAPPALSGLDLSQVRAIIVGAERLDPAVLDRFAALLAPHGLRPNALRPAYGLAEATLVVTGLPLSARWRRLVVDACELARGRAVELPPDARPAGGGVELVGCGPPLSGVRVGIHGAAVDPDAPGSGGSGPLPDGTVGEIVVHGPSVASGYEVAAPAPDAFRGAELHSGDAGFLLGGELFVLGRLGEAIKTRGRLVLAEDLESALVRAGLPARALVVLLGDAAGGPTAVALVERARPGWLDTARDVLRRDAEGARVVVVGLRPGTIARTSSGKPRRRVMWQWFLTGALPAAHLSMMDAEPAAMPSGGWTHDRR